MGNQSVIPDLSRFLQHRSLESHHKSSNRTTPAGRCVNAILLSSPELTSVPNESRRPLCKSSVAGMATAFAHTTPLFGRSHHSSDGLTCLSTPSQRQSVLQRTRRPRLKACLSLESELSALVDDVKQNGGKISSAISLKSVDEKTRRGLAVMPTAQDVLKGTELVTVPSELVLTPNSARKLLESEFPLIKPLLSILSDSALLALAVCRELSKDQSPFSSMLKTLPSLEALNAVVLWTDAELAFLQGSPVLEAAKRVKDGVDAEHLQIIAAFASTETISWLSLERYKWAIAVVDCCAAPTLERYFALAPLLHCCTMAPPGKAGNLKAEFTGGMFFTPKRLVLTAEENINPGSQLQFDGESGGNADLLLERGEVYDSEEYHCVELPFELTTMDRFFDDKCGVLEQAGLEPTNTFRFTANIDGTWIAPENLEAFLRLMCLQGTDAFLLEPVFSSSIWGFMQLPVSEENERAVYDLIIGACEDALDGYVEGDSSETGVANVSSTRKELATIVTKGERRVLNDTKEHYKKKLLSLGVLEYYAERRLKELDLLRPVEDSEIVDSGGTGFRIPQASDENYR